jgi:hypothetical protein
MRVVAFLAVLGLVIGGCATAPRSDGAGLQDYTDDFAEVFDRTASIQGPARVAAFKAYFAPLLPGFYAHERHGLADPAPYDARFLQALETYPAQRQAIAEMSRRFAALLTPAQRSFEREFGPMTGYPPILLVVSLGEFDGGTRELGGTGYLMFGADVMARLHANRDVQPFFHHELFHLYHARHFTTCEAVWCNLWTEGLAVHVAHQLNPQADDDQLLLTQPEPLRAAVEENRTEAVCAVLQRLDSTERGDNRALFSSGRLNERLPPRFGYYVGYLAAAEAGRTRSLQQLAQLRGAEVRPLIETALRALASCTP